MTEPAPHEFDQSVVKQRTEKALEKGIATVKTPEQAAQVIDTLQKAAGNLKESEVSAPAGQTQVQQTRQLEKSAKLGSAAGVIAATATQIAAAPDAHKEPLNEAVTSAMGGPDMQVVRPEVLHARSLLRTEMLNRLEPFDKADALLFIQVNRLPRTETSNYLFSRLSWVMTGGHGWLLVLLVNAALRREHAMRAFMGVAPAMWLATSIVEHPIKNHFRRQRPFMAVVQAVVVGRKPGSYSFPSGHSAAAFAGAVLLSRHLPKGRKGFFAVAGLVAFSRVYLGAHYPGDVVSGSLIGAGLARVCAKGLSMIGFPKLPPRLK